MIKSQVIDGDMPGDLPFILSPLSYVSLKHNRSTPIERVIEKKRTRAMTETIPPDDGTPINLWLCEYEIEASSHAIPFMKRRCLRQNENGKSLLE